jgi:hypothetical protein
MADDPLDLQQDSAFSAVLRWLGRPGYAVRNAVTGNFEGAARQAADFVIDPWDAFLPGDLIPQISRKGEDFTEASDLIGGMEPGLGKIAVDVAGGILTDPLTYTGLGLVKNVALAPAGAAVKVAQKVAPKIPGGVDALAKAGKAVSGAGHELRKAVGDLRVSAPVSSAIEQGKGIGSAAALAGKEFAAKTFANVDPEVSRRAFEMVRGVTSEMNPGVYDDLDAMVGLSKVDFVDESTQMSRIDARLSSMPWSPAEKAAVRKVAEDAIKFTRTKWEEGLGRGVYAQRAAAGMAPADYLPGVMEMDGVVSNPSIMASKSLRSSADLAAHLNKSGAKLDSDIGIVLTDYADKFSAAVKRAEIGRKLLPGFKTLAEHKELLTKAVKDLEAAGNMDDAVALKVAIEGLPARTGFFKWLAATNNIFKPAATGGYGIPRPAFTTGNVLSSLPMVAANPATRDLIGSTAMRSPSTLIGAWGDGLRAAGIPFAKPAHIDELEKAIAASGGNTDVMLANIQDPVLKSAIEHGVIGNGFATSEQMVQAITKSKSKLGKAHDWAKWPSEIVRGSEDRMRLGLFDDLVNKKKMSPADAAKTVKDTLYDYAYSSVVNRAIRDVIPFFQFTAKAVPQQARFLAGKGAVPAVARNIAEKTYAGNEDAILPPYMQGDPAIPIGQDEEGNAQYIANLRMPWESMGMIPNLSDNPLLAARQTRENIIGSTNPVLKTLYSAVSGNDPYFGSTFASYDKAPELMQALGADERSGFARAYNVAAGSGLIQPLASPIATISGAMDPRRDALESVVNTATGFRIKSVDETKALQQLVEEKLKMDPSIARHENLYAYSPDPEQQELLDELRRVKSEIRAKKKAAEAAVE